MPKDAIPSLLDTQGILVDAKETEREIDDQEDVIGVSIRGDIRAYPVLMLSHHEIVNDVVGGVPLVVPWCPLCYSGIVYARTVESSQFTFGVSGKLYANALIMYDHQTNSLWAHFLGKAIQGKAKGTKLKPLPSLQTTWGNWKALHPKKKVLSKSKGPNPEAYQADPYTLYYQQQDRMGILGSPPDKRLPPKEFVIGLKQNNHAKAYPFSVLSRHRVVNDQFLDCPILIVFDQKQAIGIVFDRRIKGTSHQFELVSGSENRLILVDKETQSRWLGLKGDAIEGKLKGQQLNQIPTHKKRFARSCTF